MKCKRVVVFFSLLAMLCAFVSAGDVAYIYKNEFAIDDNIVAVFESKGLVVDFIDEAILPIDFSGYRFIFVGDERFRHEDKIPISEYPTIVANYYHGEEFGLTDYDGVSQLASTSPLSVRVGSSVIPVYTQALYAVGSGISIPYYYLADENKMSGMEGVARTYTGEGQNDDFGDVISYANAGSELVSGGTTDARVCFFGIIESDFWTPAAKMMFEDCVAFVSVACEVDSDCSALGGESLYCQGDDVYNEVNAYHCENPGTPTSECVADGISNDFVEACGSDSCGAWGDSYCFAGDVYHSRDCYSAGCADAECFSDFLNSEEALVEECLYGCSLGECIVPEIECWADSGCGVNDWLGNDVCQGDDVFDDYLTFTCHSPGTYDSYCSSSTDLLLKEICSDACVDGACAECFLDSDCPADYYTDNYCSGDDVYRDLVDYSCGASNDCVSENVPELVEECSDSCVNGACQDITCSNNLDCGVNAFTGFNYCMNGNSYEDFVSFTCHNPGTLQSYCSNFTWNILSEYCDFECVSGDCISCFGDLECGTDGFIGDGYCVGDDVYQDYQSFNCEAAGTADSDCSSSSAPRLIEECADTCVAGACVPIECSTDIECDDSSIRTVDTCVYPGTVDSFCRNTPVTCLEDLECGIDGFIGDGYCVGDDVYQDYRSFTCDAAGTLNSECSSGSVPRLIEECSDTCVAGACVPIECSSDLECDDSDVYTVDSCVHPGTVDSYCHHTLVNCVSDQDCGITGFFGNEYCQGGDVFKDYQTSTCINAGTVNSYCDVASAPNLIVDCGEDSYGAWGENYCVGNDVYRNRIFNDAGCLTGACFLDSTEEDDFVAHCDLGCEDGECLLPYCGDGFVNQASEECDDGNNLNGDGCSNDCLIEDPEPYCGDGLVNQVGEECDDGNNLNGDGCSDVCLIEYPDPVCGDGLVNQVGEECDDGNLNDFDGCSSECLIETIECSNDADCGEEIVSYSCRGSEVWMDTDGFNCVNAGGYDSYCEVETGLEFSEECDDGLFCNGAETCSAGVCIDGEVVDCDVFSLPMVSECSYSPDDNDFTWDYFAGFTSVCSEVLQGCSISFFDLNHTCDLACGAECESDGDCSCEEDYCDGTTFVDYSDYSSCEEDCVCESCDYVEYPNSPICVQPYCGDGLINQASEECDDGNNLNGDGCSWTCLIEEIPQPYCGDGYVNLAWEQCDDGNNVNGDGCSSNCLVESGPYPYCGDGYVNLAWEQCDDGNNVNGDGCSSNCLVEEECNPYSWEPSPWTVCDGEQFTQINDCGDTRLAYGMENCCSDTVWSPSSDTVCLGDSFIQISNCGSTRVGIGTKTDGYCAPIAINFTAECYASANASSSSDSDCEGGSCTSSSFSTSNASSACSVLSGFVFTSSNSED